MENIKKSGVEAACLVLKTGARLCGIASNRVKEIIPLPYMVRPPQTPPIVAGVLNVRGETAIILDLAVLLGGSPSSPGLYWNIVLLRDSIPPIGILTERAVSVVHVQPGEVRPIAPQDSLNGCVSGELTNEGECIHLLDVDRLLLEKERLVLEQLQADGKRRLDELALGEGT